MLCSKIVEKNGETLFMESQKLYESQPSTSRKYPISMETHWEEDISFPKRIPHKQLSTYVFNLYAMYFLKLLMNIILIIIFNYN